MTMAKPSASLHIPLVAALLLAGCATSPPAARSSPPAAAVPVSVAAPLFVEAAAPPPAAAQPAASEPAPTALPAASDVPTQPPVAERALAVREPGDLLDRVRKGFRLPDPEQLAIDRELNWFANNPEYLERTFNRAEMYLHYIVEQLEKRDMPRELALLPVVESAFEPYAYSRASASGLWQFIPGTGSRYGLKQNWWYDGRRDVVESTRAALDYLQALHDEFDGDWLLAVAAYNCGEGNVQRAIAANLRAGKRTDFWNLKLPAETRAYVPKLLAMSRLVARPADYGLEFSKIPDEPYFVPVQTGGQIDLQVVADLTGLAKDELFQLNPAFHRFATDPSGPYSLLVPVELAEGLEATLLGLSPEQRMRVEQYTAQRGDTVATVAKRFATTDSMVRELNGLAATARLAAGQQLRVPSSSVQLPSKALLAAARVDRPSSSRRTTVHIVRRGDTLSSIARRMGTDARSLARLNDMSINDTLRTGQKLVVASRQAGSAASAGSTPRGASSAATASSGRRITYTVRRGDTLYSIARVLQVSVGELLGWNRMGSASIIKPGQKLIAFVAARG